MGAEGGVRGSTGLPFDEAIRFFRGKTNLPTSTWRDIRRNQHDAAFVVAGVTKADLLADLRGAVDRAISEGQSLADFRKAFAGIVTRHGWDPKGGIPWRAKVIFETNLRTAYAAGRWAQLNEPAFLKRNPFWEWRHGNSVHPRPHHLAWNGMVLAASNPFWTTHFPPDGWGCKCSVQAHSAAGLDRAGLEPGQAPPNPPPPEEGWDYAPGASARERLAPIAQVKADSLGGRIGDDLRREIETWLKETEGLTAEELRRRGATAILPKVRPNVRTPGDGESPGIHRTPPGLHLEEDALRTDPREWALVFDAKGRQVAALTSDLTQEVTLSRAPDFTTRIQGQVLSHTHPHDWSFSPDDIAAAWDYGAVELRAVSPNHLHRLRPGPEGWGSAEDRASLFREFARIQEQVARDQQARVDAGKLSVEDGHRDQVHLTMQRVARKFGWKYVRL